MNNLNQFGRLSGLIFVVLIAVTAFYELVAVGHWLASNEASNINPMTYKSKAAASVSPSARQSHPDDNIPNHKQMEQVVRSYLLSNPEVIVEAMRVLQERKRAEQALHNKQVVAQFKKQLLNAKNDMVWNPDGSVPVVEFFDYQCGYCKRLFPAMEKMRKDQKNARIIYKEFPILGPASVIATKAAFAAARQGKYFELHVALMGFRGKLSEKVIMQKAAEVGLDLVQLDKDMRDPKIQEKIDRNIQLARIMGINGTPTLIIGDELIPGAIAYREIDRLIKVAEKGCSIC